MPEVCANKRCMNLSIDNTFHKKQPCTAFGELSIFQQCLQFPDMSSFFFFLKDVFELVHSDCSS